MFKIKDHIQTPEASTYADAAQSKTDTSVQAIQAPQPTQQDVKALLNKLLGSQPTLLDLMSDDSSSTSDLSSLSIDLVGSGLNSSADDVTSFAELSNLLEKAYLLNYGNIEVYYFRKLQLSQKEKLK